MEGETRKVAKAVLEALRAQYPHLTAELYDLAVQPLPQFGYTQSAEGTALVDGFVQKVRSARALVLCSPEYHHSLSGCMKNALDHVGGSATRGKVAAIVSVGGSFGGIHAALALRSVCDGLRLWVTPALCSVALDDRGAEAALADPRIQARASEVLQQLVQGMEHRVTG
jgi:NAD(P)H-dependent FMN reductase